MRRYFIVLTLLWTFFSVSAWGMEGMKWREEGEGSSSTRYNAYLTEAIIKAETEPQQERPHYKTPVQITHFTFNNQFVDLEKLRHEDLSSLLGSSDPLAHMKAAFIYETYSKGPIEEDQAISHYLQAAQAGIPEAYNNLGGMYESGRGTKGKDLNKSLECYAKCQDKCLKGSYNFTRWNALYEKKASTRARAQLALGRKFADRKQGIERDYKGAAYWFDQASQEGNRHAHLELAVLYKNGLGVKKDYVRAAQLFEKAAAQGISDAQANLGRMYEFGQGVEADEEKAFMYHKMAAEQGDIASQIVIASFYEEGRGGQAQDYPMALSWYKAVTKQEEDSHAQYNAGRMYEYLPRTPENDKEALYWYRLAVEKGHPGAQFLLATRYEKGRGVKADLQKAKELYHLSAKQGHIPAQLKLAFIQRGYETDVLDFHKRSSTVPAINLLYEDAKRRLLKELEANYEIHASDDLPFQLVYRLSEDYARTQKVPLLDKEENQSSPLRLNYEFIAADPYLKYISRSEEDVADEQIDPEKFTTIFQTMKEAYRLHPAYSSDLEGGGNIILQRLGGDSQATEDIKTLRRRFLKLFLLWTDSTQGLPAPDGVADPLQYRQGEAFLRLVQNTERCRDGLSNYILEEEWKATSQTTRPLPLGVRLSFMITNYKMAFLNQHRNPLRGADEEATEASELLYQRMRLPLGLPGSFQPPLYPAIGRGEEEKYRPENVMERFLKGGQIQFERGEQSHMQTFKAYTPQFLIELLKSTLQDKDNKILQYVHVQEFIQNDLYLNKFSDNAFGDLEANEYFDPHHAFPYKTKLLEYLLVAHGYLIK